jgi:ABC-type sulfate/molybdate transport systems ATPase subunit
VNVLRADIRAQVGTLAIAAEFETNGGPLVLVGPNGAGKTSILLMLLGAREPSAGTITLHGETLFDRATHVSKPLETRGIGYLPQHYGLFPNMTALENVAFALECKSPRRTRRERTARATALLAQLEIEPVAKRYPAGMSGGERQKVALARALAAEPRALLLDEPLAAMDVTARREVRDFLRAYLAQLGLPSVVVTHDPMDARALGDRIVVLEAGRVVQSGNFSELQARPASPFVAAFVASVG